MRVSLPDAAYESLGRRLGLLHDRLLDVSPDVERVACALYDERDDLLTTFINSTRNGSALRSYQYRLSDSVSLSHLARTRELRLLDDIPTQLVPTTAHSQYVLEEGYLSSFTIPMYDQARFLGFLFFDSRVQGAFDARLQRDLMLYANIVTMAIVNELQAVRSIVGAVRVARDFTGVRDPETAEHLDRMARYARLVARRVAETHDRSDEFVEHVFLYAPLHDIGKIAVPDAILFKRGRLTEEEWVVMRSHTVRGREMIDAIVADLGLDSATDTAIMRNIVELHHEKLDGSGYPHGLRVDDIPLEARVVTVADIFDALTCERPYRQPWSLDRASEYLQELAADGKVYDEAVTALVDARAEIEDVRARYADAESVAAEAGEPRA